MRGTLPCMSTRATAADLVPRVVGLLVFLVGIGLLVYVFRQADILFHGPQITAPTPVPSPAPKGSAGAVAAPAGEALGQSAVAVGAGLADLLFRLLALLLMSVAGGLIAALGVRLVGATRRDL